MKYDIKALISALLCALALRFMLPELRGVLGMAFAELIAADTNADAVIETMGALIAPGGMRGALAYGISPSREYISCLSAGNS